MFGSPCTTPARPVREAANAALASADAAWMTELAAVFGPARVDAVAAAPEGQGAPGSRLRALFDAHTVARAAWRAAHDGHGGTGLAPTGRTG